jgi:hypothetical protein
MAMLLGGTRGRENLEGAVGKSFCWSPLRGLIFVSLSDHFLYRKLDHLLGESLYLLLQCLEHNV